ncbi:MAG: 2-oxo acid dehydrogenase subunit E2, partial [Candidatus Nanopelagicales bacterium]
MACEGKSRVSSQPQQEFGPNQWLVDELYQQYLTDPGSVDPAWHGFFEDYRPSDLAAVSTTSAPPVSTPAGTDAAPAATPQAVPPTPSAAPSQPAPATPKTATPTDGSAGSDMQILRGPAARVVANMEASLGVPTATSVRAIPAKLLIDNRIVINNHLKRSRGGKISFTHVIAWAMIRALKALPELNAAYTEVDDKPVVLRHEHINLGLAIDLQKPDGTRQLVVPAVKAAQDMDFAQFWAAYEDIVRRARAGKLTADDFAGTTISLTNPGTIGTIHSVPRLMQGQGAIVGVGALEYPAEYQGASSETLARLAISKILTLTSTYDHRIIQGAQSGDFLRRIHAMLLGDESFYDEVFAAMRIP